MLTIRRDDVRVLAAILDQSPGGLIERLDDLGLRRPSFGWRSRRPAQQEVTVARPLTVAGIFAHPDDETWSLAGSFALLVPKGVRGAVWTATRGQAGEIAEGSGATRETLAEVREAEERAAMAVVGVERVEFGELVDGQVEADRDALTAEVHRFLEREQPDVVVTMEPGGVTAHPDHMAVSAAVQAAFGAYAAGPREREPRFYYWGVPVSEMAGWRGWAGPAASTCPARTTLRDQGHPRRAVHLHGRHLRGGRAGLAGPVPAPHPGRRRLVPAARPPGELAGGVRPLPVHPRPPPARRPTETSLVEAFGNG